MHRPIRPVARVAALAAMVAVIATAATSCSETPSSSTGASTTASTPASIESGLTSVSSAGLAPTSTLPVPTTGSTPSTTAIADDATTIATTTTTTTPVPTYVFPFVGRDVSYGTTHHDYPAVDVFGCGAIVVAPTAGTVLEISTEDRWDPAVNDPATRGGLFVSMLGGDGVRYYVAHLGEVLVATGAVVEPGSPLGVMGATGNARNSECHTHLGISWVCPGPEWQVRRGEIWPAPYLDAWRSGDQRSPSAEIAARAAEMPTACTDAMALVTAG